MRRSRSIKIDCHFRCPPRRPNPKAPCVDVPGTDSACADAITRQGDTRTACRRVPYNEPLVNPAFEAMVGFFFGVRASRVHRAPDTGGQVVRRLRGLLAAPMLAVIASPHAA